MKKVHFAFGLSHRYRQRFSLVTVALIQNFIHEINLKTHIKK